MIEVLTRNLFFLPEDKWTQVVTSMDPRGYVDVYGEDIGAIHPIAEGSDISFRALTLFWDYITVEIVGHFDLVITPKEKGLEILVYSQNGSSRKFIQDPRSFNLMEFISQITNLSHDPEVAL